MHADSVTMCLAAGDTKTRLLDEPSIARLCMRAVADGELAESMHCALPFAFGALLAGRVADCLALLRRLSAVLFASRSATMQPKSLGLCPVTKRAAAWTSAGCTCQARAGPRNTSSLIARKSSNV